MRRNRREVAKPETPGTNAAVVEPQAIEPEPKPHPRYLADGETGPTHFVKALRKPLPCPRCRQYTLHTGSQAVVCTSSRHDTAWFRCKGCGQRFEMPVKVVE